MNDRNDQVRRMEARANARARDLPSFIAMDVNERAQQLAAQGADIVYLLFGEPDFEPPPAASEAAIRAIREGKTHYTHSLGLRELRLAIRDHYAATYGVDVDPERIVVSGGTSPCMHMLFSALLEEGDEVIMADPAYACYPQFVSFVGGKPVSVRVTDETGFRLEPEAIRGAMTERTKAVLINSPTNPTGSVLPGEWLREICDLGLPVVSDEVYHGLVYEGETHTVLEYSPDAFVLNGFSKAYAMTGFRLGYMIVPEAFVRPLQKIQQNFYICPSDFVQWAGIAALREGQEYVARMRAEFDRRRRYVVQRLEAMGVAQNVRPTGAFYALARIDHINPDSYAFAFDLLEKAYVAVTPGIDFGPGLEGWIRISYANNLEAIEEGLDRLEKYLAERS